MRRLWRVGGGKEGSGVQGVKNKLEMGRIEVAVGKVRCGIK